MGGRHCTGLRLIIISGLSLQRSLYLYERVREYVRDPKKRGKVCPKPPPGTGADSGTASSLPGNDQPGPSTAIPHSPTVEGHESADHDTYRETQGNFNGCISGRRKRRPRSELILAYQCTVCGKKYGSSQALYLHRRNTHKQPAATGDGHSDAIKVNNSCDAEGSQGLSKRKRRRKAEIERTFSCSVCGKKYDSQAAVITHRKSNHGS